MKQLKAIMVILACLVPAWAYAQGDDFPDLPPPPFVNPQPSPFPPFSDQGPYKWRTVGGSQTISALKGWKFTVKLHVNWFPGAMWLQPVMSDGAEIKYVSGFFYHGNAGNWCIDECTFEGIAGSDYPELSLQAYAPYRFIETNGAYLYVTEIVPNPAQPTVLLDIFTKNNFRAISVGLYGGSAITAYAGVRVIGFDWPVGAMLLATSFGSYFLAGKAGRIADDPWDDNYGEPYEAQVDPELQDGLAWVCTGDGGDFCHQLVDAIEQTDALTKAVGVSLDRAQSCIDVRAGCEEWQRERAVDFFHQAAPWAGWLGTLYGQLADYMQQNGINADRDPDSEPADAIGTLWSLRDQLWNMSNTSWQVQ